MVVNTQTVERYLFIYFIILIYIAERSQMSILINFRILQHKRFDVIKNIFYALIWLTSRDITILRYLPSAVLLCGDCEFCVLMRVAT